MKKIYFLFFKKRPKIKIKRSIALKFAMKKALHRFDSFFGGIRRVLGKFVQPLTAVDKHRGSEMFATLSLHRLAIVLSAMVC